MIGNASRRCTSDPLTVANGSVHLGLDTDGATLRDGLRPLFPQKGGGLADSIASADPVGVSLCRVDVVGFEPTTHG